MMQDRHAEGYVAATGFSNSEKRPVPPAAGASVNQPKSEWSNPYENSRPSNVQNASFGGRYCVKCGLKNPVGANFCNRCGTKMVSQETGRNEYDPYGQYSEPYVPKFDVTKAPDFEEPMFDDVRVDDIDQMIGKGSFYYLSVFRRIVNAKSIGRFHFPAFLFGGIWMLYRKQYKYGILVLLFQIAMLISYLCVNVFVAGPIIAQLYEAAGITGGITNLTMMQQEALYQALANLSKIQLLMIYLPNVMLGAYLIFMVLLGMTANRLYLSHLKSRVRAIRAKNESDGECYKAFRNEGGVSSVNVAFAVGAIIIAYMVLRTIVSFILL